MEDSAKQFRKDYIGNIHFEFFTENGSLTIEAWKSTRRCRIRTFSHGIGKETEVKLNDTQWWKLVIPVSYSGFWKWERRYDTHVQGGYVPSWRTSFTTKYDWYYSSGDGVFPEGFMGLLKGLSLFVSEIEAIRAEPAGCFLGEYLQEGEA